jgi:hypothetical protein
MTYDQAIIAYDAMDNLQKAGVQIRLHHLHRIAHEVDPATPAKECLITLAIVSELRGDHLPMITAPKRLSKTQRADMLEIIQAVNAGSIATYGGAWDILDINDDDVPEWEWVLDWPLWSAGENMPGYLPDSPYCLFLTERAAIGYCRELEHEEGHKSGGYVTNYMPVTLREILGS